jgi:predicted O-methyltransferase YrrM
MRHGAHIFMNSQIDSIYSSRKAIGRSGAEFPLHSEIDPAEGAFIQQVISQDATISRSLEVGCAYGLSSLHICDALSSRTAPQHTIIDPFQSSVWDGAGVRNLEEAGFRFFKLIEERSEFALPELLKVGEERYDFIFVDGWHTFDHTLIDCFYATRLLRTGGYLLVDDVQMAPVRRVVDYLSNYPCFRIHAAVTFTDSRSVKRRMAGQLSGLLPEHTRKKMIHPALLSRLADQRTPRMLAFKKIAKDERAWNWFPDSF